jgi:hypothetical protein
VTDPGSPTPPPSHPTAWGSNVGPPPSTPVTHATASTIVPSTPPRKRWIVVLVGVLVLILGIAVSGTVLFATNTLPPLDAASDFANDLEVGRFQSAYAQTCDRLQAVIEPDDLASLNDDRYRVNYVVNPLSVDRNGNRAHVDITAQGYGARDLKYTLYLVHEDGDWRVCDVRFRDEVLD